MTKEWLIEKIKAWAPEAQIIENQMVMVQVDPDKFKDLIRKLKDSETLFDYLFCQSGYDDGQKLGINYFLESTNHKLIVVIKSETENRENPEFESVSDLYHTANLNEREISEMYGIHFKGHPDMRKLLLPDEIEGYPMRKDYTDSYTLSR